MNRNQNQEGWMSAYYFSINSKLVVINLHISIGFTLPIKKRYISYIGKLRSIWIRSDWRRDKRMLANLHLGTKTNVWIWICPKPNQARPLIRKSTFAKWPSAECWHRRSFYIVAFSWLSHIFISPLILFLHLFHFYEVSLGRIFTSAQFCQTWAVSSQSHLSLNCYHCYYYLSYLYLSYHYSSQSHLSIPIIVIIIFPNIIPHNPT